MQKIRFIISSLIISLGGALTIGVSSAAALPVLVQPHAFAVSTSEACKGLSELNSSQSCTKDGQKSLLDLVKATVNILSIIVGAVAVLAVVLSGFKYITAGGDSNKVGSAKSTLVYALVGLAVAVLAQAIVRFVLTNAVTVAN